MCGYDDDCEPVTVASSEWVRARKEHRCGACYETIRAGDRYHRHSTLFEGEWSVLKHCARCWQMCEALWAVGAESIELRLNCGEKWEENFGSLPPEVAALAFLTPEEAQARLPAVPVADPAGGWRLS